MREKISINQNKKRKTIPKIDYDNDSIEDIWNFESEKYDGMRDRMPSITEKDEVIIGKFHETDADIIFYLKNNKLHRTDGPAVISPDTIEWYQNDKKHRVNGPAEIGALSYVDNEKYYGFYYYGEEALDNLDNLPKQLLIDIIETKTNKSIILLILLIKQIT